MRKITTFLGMLALAYLAGSCSESSLNQPEDADLPASTYSNTRTFGQLKRCATQEMLAERLKQDPSLASRMEAMESSTERLVAGKALSKLDPDQEVTIWVVVNVLYNTPAENISMAQIKSQIDVLNEDFSALNSDISGTPSPFDAVTGNMKIKFKLNKVNRKYTKQTLYENEDMKKFSKGGIDPTNPSENLNIWLARIPYLGYAYFPGTAPLAIDGVVVDNFAFGRIGSLYQGYDKGRTATHEIGHWLNLKHIWGNGNGCGTDNVDDTPKQAGPNFGDYDIIGDELITYCPDFPHPSTCSSVSNEPEGGDMFMNYMDYVWDKCMFMFSKKQVKRARATFEPGGGRTSWAN